MLKFGYGRKGSTKVKKTASLFNFPTYYSLPSNITVVLNYPQAIVPSKPTPTALDELEEAEAASSICETGRLFYIASSVARCGK
jgi:hypothetical protein